MKTSIWVMKEASVVETMFIAVVVAIAVLFIAMLAICMYHGDI